MQAKTMLVEVVEAIVDYPDDVRVECESLETHDVYILYVDARDRYAIVNGDAYAALCTILKAAGGKLNRRIELAIEPTD